MVVVVGTRLGRSGMGIESHDREYKLLTTYSDES